MTKYTNDLEDSGQLDAEEVETFEFWATKQKDLVTSTVDYNLNTLAELINDETIDLNPTHQRRLRWNLAKQSKLIESFLMNVPVPPIFLNEDEYGRYSVIDGKQRLSAVTSFLSNNLVLEGLEIFADINGNKFNDLPSKLRSIIRTRPTLRAIIILRQSDSDVKNEVFHRLNTGGEQLNPQEIRNNAYHGTLNNLIMELSESKTFHNALGIKNKYRSSIYQEMRDAEFVLRFFTFKDDWEVFTGGVRRRLDSFHVHKPKSGSRNPVRIPSDLSRYPWRGYFGLRRSRLSSLGARAARLAESSVSCSLRCSDVFLPILHASSVVSLHRRDSYSVQAAFR